MSDGRQEICIVGIGQTQYARRGRLGDRGELSLACEALITAAADAGIAVTEIDGLCSYANDSCEPALLSECLGLPKLMHASMAWGGGGVGVCAALAQAVSALRDGQANMVAVIRSICQSESKRYSQTYRMPHGQNFHVPFGIASPASATAPLAQRYLTQFGITAEEVGEVALSFRANANRNPAAVMHDKRLTIDDYLSSRIIAEPFRLYDCCQESDGACAVLLSTAPRARDLRRKPVHVLAAGFGNDPGWGTGSGSHNMSAADYISSPAKTLSKRLYAMAGVDPSQIDTAQIYDHFAPFVLMQLEAYGFCSQGEGGRYVAEGNIRWPDGALPVNTAGGHLSEAYIHGLNLVVEGVRQMRGDATSQVSQARLCLIGCGGSGAILAN